MNKKSRFICYLLVFVFGCLYLKNLLPNIDTGESNCQEIGHIHNYKSAKINSSKINAFEKASSTSSDSDDDCHEGKLAMSSSPFPAVVYDFARPQYEIDFDVIANLENYFQSPDISVPKEPPRRA